MSMSMPMPIGRRSRPRVRGGQVLPDEIPVLIDTHREIVAAHAPAGVTARPGR